MNEQTTKKCTMCGVDKPHDQFRKYPNGKRYPYCLDCQTIETRRRYLEQIEAGQGLSEELHDELDSIRQLYEARLKVGLNTFGTRQPKSARELVSKQMEQLRKDNSDNERQEAKAN